MRMLRKPFADLRIPVRGIVVDDRVDRLSLGNVRVDLIEEADEFLMPMALHVRPIMVPSRALRAARGRAVALVVVRIVPARPGFIGSPGWVRSRAWIWPAKTVQPAAREILRFAER
jgi:hypothetical protein